MQPERTAEVRCPECAGAVRDWGALTASNLFAGQQLDRIVPGGRLYRCEACHLGFRHPRPGKSELDALYAGGSEASWTCSPEDRPDWRLASETIRQRKGGDASVLDVGCFDGTFLSSLEGNGGRYGIEIQPAAARRAKSRGIDILADDYTALERSSARFDVITAFDVIEHVESPPAFLALLAGLLNPGGLLIMSTGNMDAPSWQLMQSRYWYCAIAEHISFLGQRWFEGAARASRLEVIDMTRYAHIEGPARRRVQETAANLVYLCLPPVFGYLRRRGYGNVSDRLDPSVVSNYPPGWLTARDHVLVTLAAADTARAAATPQPIVRSAAG